MSAPRLKVRHGDEEHLIPLDGGVGWESVGVLYVDEQGREWPLVYVDDFYSPRRPNDLDEKAEATVYLHLGEDDPQQIVHWNPRKEAL